MTKQLEALIAEMKKAAGREMISRDASETSADWENSVSPESVLALIEALERSQHLINKIKSESCNVDMSQGAVIPNSLDAWGRPVAQYLPYDFSGNPGASATQYCNGWNDAGGYWLNYVNELRSRVAELEASPLAVKLPDYRNSPDMHTKQYYETIGFNLGLDACAEAIRAAGGTVEGE